MLTELLINPHARRQKAIKKEDIAFPPKLPDRAKDKKGDEARLLGPFSIRREFNIRRDFFTNQIRTVYPPLEISRSNPNGYETVGHSPSTTLGFRNGAIDHIEGLAGWIRLPTIPRREQTELSDGDAVSKPCGNEDLRGTQLPTRWLRRRYRELLYHIPIVSQTVGKDGKPHYRVSLSRNALGHNNRYTQVRVGVARRGDLEWIERASKL